MARDDLERTAYHEAGHALAAQLWTGNITYVTIAPGEENLGHLRRERMLPACSRGMAILYARVDLAGYAAEHERFGEPSDEIRELDELDVSDWGAGDPSHDLTRAVENMGIAYPTSRQIDRRVLRQYAVDRVFLRDNFESVRQVATALIHKTCLDGGELFKLTLPGRMRMQRWLMRGVPRLRTPSQQTGEGGSQR